MSILLEIDPPRIDLIVQGDKSQTPLKFWVWRLYMS